MKNEIHEKLEKLKKWWDGDNEEPLIGVTILKEENFVNLNEIWKNRDKLPDFDKFVDGQIKNCKRLEYHGISYPALPHLWGSRGTPMVMAAYLGAPVIFREETVWFDKFINDWKNIKIEFNPENFWVIASKKLMEKQIEKINENLLIWMPDLGDALTCFSLARGVEELLIDIIEIPDLILEKIEEFVISWIKAHQYFYKIYQKKLPGEATWLIWAPGKTYACQSDFSTMISPKLFEKFVVYELEKLKDYLEYIAWHLDGPDEIKHLDILLSLPYIKTIQIVPGAGKPPCASSLWLPNIKKIIEKGKNVIVYVNNQEEFEIIIKNFPSGKILIHCPVLNLKEERDVKFFKELERFI